MQKAFGKEEMGHSQVKDRFRWFKEERMSVKSDEGLGRPSTSRNQLMINKVHSAMLGKWRTTIRELSDKLRLSLFWYSPF
jgi:hypothetical protein